MYQEGRVHRILSFQTLTILDNILSIGFHFRLNVFTFTVFICPRMTEYFLHLKGNIDRETIKTFKICTGTQSETWKNPENYSFWNFQLGINFCNFPVKTSFSYKIRSPTNPRHKNILNSLWIIATQQEDFTYNLNKKHINVMLTDNIQNTQTEWQPNRLKSSTELRFLIIANSYKIINK